MPVLAFDIFGTLIDPLSMEAHLEPLFGSRARQASELWREKQLEYAFRRALMQRYENFDVCTMYALQYVSLRLGVPLNETDQQALLNRYRELPAFADVDCGLERLSDAGQTLVAFSNGTEKMVRGLLDHAGVLSRFRDVISVDDVKTFKPSPAVYEYLVRRAGVPKESIALVSSNPFDIAGAQFCGLRTAWLQRDRGRIFDAWPSRPDVTVATVEGLVGELDRLFEPSA